MRKILMMAVLGTLIVGGLSACVIEPIYPVHRCWRC